MLMTFDDVLREFPRLTCDGLLSVEQAQADNFVERRERLVREQPHIEKFVRWMKRHKIRLAAGPCREMHAQIIRHCFRFDDIDARLSVGGAILGAAMLGATVSRARDASEPPDSVWFSLRKSDWQPFRANVPRELGGELPTESAYAA